MSEWNYSGDVSIACGGMFVEVDRQNFKWGYLNFVEVTDLDSACGFRGACLIERGTVNGTDDKARIMSALKCVGMTPRDLLKMKGNTARMMAIAYALRSYGYVDYDRTEVVQTEAGQPMRFDGWKAEKVIRESDLKGYVESQWLD